MKKDKNPKETEDKAIDKFSKIFLIVLLAIIFAVILSVTLFNIFNVTNKEENKDSGKSSKYNTNIKYVSMLEDNTYYVFNLSEKIAFEVKNNDKNSFVIKDKNGEKVPASIKENKGQYFIVADKKYNKGETYTLELKENSFINNKIKEASSITFKIKRDKVAEYEFSDKVTEVNASEVTLSEDKKTLSIKDADVKERRNSINKARYR